MVVSIIFDGTQIFDDFWGFMIQFDLRIIFSQMGGEWITTTNKVWSEAKYLQLKLGYGSQSEPSWLGNIYGAMIKYKARHGSCLPSILFPSGIPDFKQKQLEGTRIWMLDICLKGLKGVFSQEGCVLSMGTVVGYHSMQPTRTCKNMARMNGSSCWR